MGNLGERERAAILAMCADLRVQIAQAERNVAYADKAAQAYERQRDELLAAYKAAIRYDEAIQSCANDPDKMASHCTAQSEGLDILYFDWLDKARAGIAEIQGEAD